MANIRARRFISTALDSARLVSGWAVSIFLLGLAGCSTAEKPKIETTPVLVAQSQEVPATTKLPAPETTEVTEAVRRIFKDSVEIDSRRQPVFIDGDFNGDRSRDLAVVVRPVLNRLSDLNEEFPTWILKDPFSSAEPRIPRLRIAADDTLLAVIHGFGLKGWRDSQATQTFVLKNAVGSGMAAYQPKDLVNANKGKIPYLQGDVIGQVVDGTLGYLYFDRATYSWYDPNTYRPETRTDMAHLRKKKK